MSAARKDKGPLRPSELPVMRPGLPPGHCDRRMHDIDDILLECHRLALYAESQPDTS
jgi:hypothetical protein